MGIRATSVVGWVEEALAETHLTPPPHDGFRFALPILRGLRAMSNIPSYQGYTAHVEFDAEDQILHGRVYGIRDMVTFEGATVDALIADFYAAVDHYLAVCRQRGEAPQQPYSGRLLLRMDPATHAAAARQAEAEGKSLSAWATEVLKRAANTDSASR